MALDDKAVEAHVEGLLRQRGDQFAFASDMGGIDDDRQRREAQAQFGRNVPLRHVAVEMLAVCAESAVDSSQPAYACIVDALHCADPQLDVGIDGVLHEYGDVGAARLFNGVGDLLHRERIGRCAGADPEYVDSGGECVVDVLAGGDLGGGVHAGSLLDFFQPFEARGSYAFESARFCAGFPYSGAEYFDAVGGEFAGCAEHLFFGLGAAWAGYDEGTLRIDALEGDGLQIFHCFVTDVDVVELFVVYL